MSLTLVKQTGSFVYANAYAMCYDTDFYKSPETFNPLRFAPKEQGGNAEPYPNGHFGFGRRICPGRHLAEASVWIVSSDRHLQPLRARADVYYLQAITTMLATINIKKTLDKDGKQITPEVILTPGLTSHPEHFECRLTPRSKAAVELVHMAL